PRPRRLADHRGYAATVRSGGAAAPALCSEHRLDPGDRRRGRGLLAASRGGAGCSTQENREGHDDATDLSHDEPPAHGGAAMLQETSPKTSLGVKTESPCPKIKTR